MPVYLWLFQQRGQCHCRSPTRLRPTGPIWAHPQSLLRPAAARGSEGRGGACHIRHQTNQNQATGLHGRVLLLPPLIGTSATYGQSLPLMADGATRRGGLILALYSISGAVKCTNAQLVFGNRMVGERRVPARQSRDPAYEHVCRVSTSHAVAVFVGGGLLRDHQLHGQGLKGAPSAQVRHRVVLTGL